MVSPFDAMRKQLDKMYDSKCTIINYIEKNDEYGTTTHTPVTVAKEQPCKLSYTNSNNATQTKTVDNVEQTIKVAVILLLPLMTELRQTLLLLEYLKDIEAIKKFL